ncbi:hypothetical protein LT493_25890 [Streptomyces tricolor]|nr:hypothetical protein [Streptomyces tricolor]
MHRFLDTLDSGGIQVAQLIPSYLEVVLSALAERPRPLPAALCVGDRRGALSRELVQRWFDVLPSVLLVKRLRAHRDLRRRNHGVMDRVPAGALGASRPGRAQRPRCTWSTERLALVPLSVPGEIVFSGVCVGARLYQRRGPHQGGVRLGPAPSRQNGWYARATLRPLAARRHPGFLGRRDAPR